MNAKLIVAGLLVIVNWSPCHAQCTPSFSDDFEFYAPGTLTGVGGWATGFIGTGTPGSITGSGVLGAPLASSGVQMLQMSANTHSQQPLSLNCPGNIPTTGQWVLTAWQYLQSGSMGIHSVSILDAHAPAGSSVAITLLFDLQSGLVSDAFAIITNTLNIQYNQWVETRFEIDVNSNLVDVYYAGALLGSRPFSTFAAIPTIASFDFVGGGIGSFPAYYDDVELAPAARLYETNDTIFAATINGAQGNAQSFAAVTLTSGITASLQIWSSNDSLVGRPYEAVLDVGPPVPSWGTTVGGQVINLDLASPSFFWLNSLHSTPTLVPLPQAPGFVWNLVLPPASGLTATFQAICADNTHPDGFRLSQPTTFTVN